jgi:putative Holliday junction resolvase
MQAISERGAELLVVGMPLDQDGQKTAVCESVERFARRVAKRVNIKVEFVDESFSSEEAAERLKLSGAQLRQAGAQVELDAYAACLILERYLA